MNLPDASIKLCVTAEETFYQMSMSCNSGARACTSVGIRHDQFEFAAPLYAPKTAHAAFISRVSTQKEQVSSERVLTDYAADIPRRVVTRRQFAPLIMRIKLGKFGCLHGAHLSRVRELCD